MAPAATGTATRFGWYLGQAVRMSVALLLLGGLLGAALGSARSESLPTLTADLDSGRVSEVVLTDGRGYGPPVLRGGAEEPTVRWKVVGGGWRTARLGDEPVPPDPAPEQDEAPGGGQDAVTASIRRQAEEAGVPVSVRGDQPARRLIGWATLTSLVLVLVLIGAPQPRRATKWAWFWLMLVPGGLVQLAWLAIEAPWSSRANRLPEPLPHSRQDGDGRLTAGPALLLTFVLAGLVGVAGHFIGGWLAG